MYNKGVLSILGRVYLNTKLFIGTSAIILLFGLTTVSTDTLLSSATPNLDQTKVNSYNEPINNHLLSLNVLTNSLENRLYGVASILEFASNLPEMKSVPNVSLLNTTL